MISSLGRTLVHRTAPASPLSTVVSAPSAPSVFAASLSAALSVAGVCAAAGGLAVGGVLIGALPGGWQVGALGLALNHLQHMGQQS